MNKIEELVREQTKNENTGHGLDHAINVRRLALEFSKNEKVNRKVIELASLLHDVDDYKIIGKENAEKQLNAKSIMNKLKIDNDLQRQVLDIIKNMGYSNCLRGIRPKTMEGKIVSDADMCEALGANAIIRTISYTLLNNNSRGIIFDKNIFPDGNIDYKKYTSETSIAINHFFEKILKLPGLLMTESGKAEGEKRKKIVIDFLREFFRENYLEDWSNYLEIFIKNSL